MKPSIGVRLISICVSCVFTTASPLASEVCEDIEEILADSKNLFRTIKGSLVQGTTNWYTARKVIPGATECLVEWDGGDFGEYWCDWEFTSKQDAEEHFMALREVITPCLFGKGDFEDSETRETRTSRSRRTQFAARSFDNVIDNDTYTVDVDLDYSEFEGRRGVKYEASLTFSAMYW